MRPTVPPDYPDDAIPEPVHKGRGALSNESSRYDGEKRIRTTDGWEHEASPDPSDDDDLPPLRTTLTRDATRTILARNTSPGMPVKQVSLAAPVPSNDGFGPWLKSSGPISATSTVTVNGQSYSANNQVFGWIGPPPRNGDWAPHVHVQVILDLLGLGAKTAAGYGTFHPAPL